MKSSREVSPETTEMEELKFVSPSHPWPKLTLLHHGGINPAPSGRSHSEKEHASFFETFLLIQRCC